MPISLKKRNIKPKVFLIIYKNGSKFFNDIEIEENITPNQTPIFLKNVDTEKILVSNKISFGEKNQKYFIGYLYNGHEVKPLHIMLCITSADVKSYDGQTKWIYYLIEDNDLLLKYNTIWDSLSI